jgi:hypothetical protein
VVERTMVSHKRRYDQLDALKILIVLGLAFYITYSLHQNYAFPLHGDEWVYWARSEAILQANSATFIDPFIGKSTLSPASNWETGFQLFWGIFHLVTDLSWLDIFRYFPSIIFLVTTLNVYVFAEREGFGFEAALLTCLIPTTVGILGPALLVPVAMGMLFVPLSFFIVFNLQTWSSYLILAIINLFLLIMHPPSAFIIFTILVPYILLNVRSNFKHSLGMTLAITIPLIGGFAWRYDRLVNEMQVFFTYQNYNPSISIPSIVQTFGYLPIALSILGTVFLLMKGGRKNYGLIFGLFTLLTLLVIFIRLHWGAPILYERGLLYLMLMLAVVGGAGLDSVKIVRFPIKYSNCITLISVRNVGKILFVVIICVLLAIGIPSRHQTHINQYIDNEDYRAFVWIRENLDEQYRKAILDPWKATAFTAITQKNVYSRIHEKVQASDKEAYIFFEDGCINTPFLKRNGISIVYTQCDCDNPDLIKIREDVYVLRELEIK